nr:helix-turn-helix transcriptional regulator [Achromobacter ruhlandii]
MPDNPIGHQVKKEKEKKGHHLRLALRAAMHQRSHSISYVANCVGISQNYLSELMRGDKPLENVSDKHLRAFATYLGVPPVAGFVLAGRLDASDFLEEVPPLEERLATALSTVCASPSAAEAQIQESDLATLPVPVKMLIVLLYQQAQQAEVFRPSQAWWESRRIVFQD